MQIDNLKLVIFVLLVLCEYKCLNMSVLDGKYVNLLIDFGFKKLFGIEFNKILLIDFLNQIFLQKYRIKDLFYLRNE